MPEQAARPLSQPITDWREALREYAHDLCVRAQSGRAPRASGDGFPEIAREALGEQAEVVRAIVDQLAAGVAAMGGAGRERAGALDAQLSLILEGVAPRLRRSVPANNAASHGRPQLFQSDLWQLLHKVRESSELSYAREMELVELDRRALFFLQRQGALTPAGISAATGVDKAQVSRSIKRLIELGLVERGQIRSPIVLSPSGVALSERLGRLAELRNRELTLDIGDDELGEFLGTVEILLDRAVQLYEGERDMSGMRGPADPDVRNAFWVEDRRAGEKIPVDRARVVSPLLTLMSYFSRSGALAFKRLTGLSNFEAWVLSEISYDPPTDWPRLVSALQRDHSQAGRTVNALIDQGLVVREGQPGRRHGKFSPTGRGVELYRIIFETGQKRAEFLLAPLPADQLARFMATFEKVRRNAALQLERERTLREMESA